MMSKENEVFQCVLVCDSFHNYYGPIGEHYPSCLLPLINRPILDYTLNSLRVSGIQEVYIFASSHADHIRSYIQTNWLSKDDSEFLIAVYSSDHYFSLGEVLRDLFAKAIIRNDFILLYGDAVCNLPFKQFLEEHRSLRSKDKLCVMTLLFRLSSPVHRTRRKDDDAITVLNAENKRLLCHEKIHLKKIDLDVSLFQSNKDVEVHFDLQDTYISICSPSVISLFADNFDYQTRDDFIRGIMGQEEILGNTIYVKILKGSHYAARAVTPMAYDAVSRDMLQRWSFPVVPDLQNGFVYQRNHIYKQGSSNITEGSLLTKNIAIGRNSIIGANVEINCSVIGANCKIGQNVKIEGAYIWDNAVIGDDCIIKTSIIGKGAHIKPRSNISGGCLIADNVVLGPDVTLKEASYIDSKPQDADEGDKVIVQVNTSLLGKEAVGYIWTENNGEDGIEDDGDDSFAPEIWGIPLDESDEERSTTSSSDNEVSDEELDFGGDGDDAKKYYSEVLDSLIRGIEDKIKCENLIVELNASKHAYNIQYKDVSFLVSRAVIDTVNKLQLQENKVSAARTKAMIKHLLPLITNYIKDKTSKKDCLKAIEEYTLSNLKSTSSVPIMVHTLSYLYEEDVIDEDLIIDWHSSIEPVYSVISETDHDEKAQKSLRCQSIMLKFINWLNEAEEESDSE